MPDRPTHFEVPVDDPDRAEKFYADVFGWTFDRYPGAPNYYGMATTGDSNPGVNGALFQRTEGSGVTLTMSVDSIEDAEAKITAAGGTVVQAKQPIPGMGGLATYKGTGCDTFGTLRLDEKAG